MRVPTAVLFCAPVSEELPKKRKKKKKPKASALASQAVAEPVEQEKTDKDEKKKKAPPPLPGAGTPDGETLRKAARAFEVGDYALVRRLCAELENAADPSVRDAARDFAARIAIDPVQVVIVLACAAVLVTIAYVWVF